VFLSNSLADTFDINVVRRLFIVLAFQLKPHKLTSVIGNLTNINKIRATVKAKLIKFATYEYNL
jgi:hypothetical protein